MTDSNCVFCKISSPYDTEETAKDFLHHDNCFSFTPLNPVVDGHRLFVTNFHADSAADDPKGASLAFEEACEWGRGRTEDFNVIVNIGPDASQTVFHTHIHYVPRREGDGLMLPWTNQVKD